MDDEEKTDSDSSMRSCDANYPAAQGAPADRLRARKEKPQVKGSISKGLNP